MSAPQLDSKTSKCEPFAQSFVMDNSTSSSGDLPNIGPFYGPIYIGGMLTVAFTSVVWLQTIHYFSRYPRDRIVIKAMVLLLVALINVQMILVIVRGYQDFVSRFGDRRPAFIAVPEYVYSLPLSALIAVIVQSYLIRRIWLFFGRNRIIPIVFAPIVLYELLASTIYPARVLRLRTELGREVALIESYSLVEVKLMLSYYAISPVVDMAIAGCMCFYLSKKSQETPFTGTAALLHRLAILSIASGLWTTIFAFMTLIFATALPVTNFYALSNFPLGALYVNSCMMNLNSRRFDDTGNTSSQRGTTGSVSTSNHQVFQLAPMNRQEVHVSVVREQDKRGDTFSRLPDAEREASSGEGSFMNLKHGAI